MHNTESDIGRLRVVVVAQATPAQGGIATFAEALVLDPTLRVTADVRLLNTTRQAVREAGGLSFANVRNALVDTVRVFRAGRRADVVHLQVAPGRLFPLVRTVALCEAARLSGAGVLCHVHSGRINGGLVDGFSPGRSFRTVLRRLARYDRVLTVSDPGTRVLRALLSGVPVETVNNAVDVADFALASPARRPVLLLFVGTLSERKGLQDLAAACALLAARHDLPPWRLEVVGGAAEVGEDEAEQQRAALRGAGFGDALLGPLRGPALHERFEGAGVFVLPSHWEGQPMVILEAMASGLPIVATTVGAVPDVVREGVDGLLVPPGDPAALAEALACLVADDDLRATMGSSARKRAEADYDLPVLGRRLAAIYAETARPRR